MSTSPHLWLAALSAALAVGLFVYTGISLFQRGWSSYEENFVGGAERTLDSMWLTLPAQHVFYLAILCAAVLAAFGGVLLSPALAVPMGIIGLLIPRLVLWLLKRQRDQRFNEQLVDALMNISNSMKAGLTLPQAFEALAREMPNPMRQEMRLLTQELRLGVETDEALQHLLRRMPSDDLDLVITAVAIVRDVGGNLTEVFDNIAHTIRERFRIEGKIRSLTAQGKAQALVICLLPFAVLLGMEAVSPGFSQALFDTALGGVVIFGCLMVMGAGIFLIRKIITIDV